MTKYPRFEAKNPSNREEKLIMELIKDLDEVTHVFIKLNNPGNVTKETFVILRDAAIGYAGGMVRDLTKLLKDKSMVHEFTEEAKNIFFCYIDQVREDLK